MSMTQIERKAQPQSMSKLVQEKQKMGHVTSKLSVSTTVSDIMNAILHSNNDDDDDDDWQLSRLQIP